MISYLKDHVTSNVETTTTKKNKSLRDKKMLFLLMSIITEKNIPGIWESLGNEIISEECLP